jgi:OOP family OmpA-OmpF porin
MKNLNKVAMLFASVALTAPMIGFAAGHTGMAKPIAKPTAEQFKYASGADQWRAADGTVWMNGTNELCWRDANWTPATAYPGCDGAAMPPAAPKAAAPAPAPAPAAKPAAPAAKPAQPPAATKVTYAADAFFDFDKAVLKPEGKAKLDDLTGKIKGINLEVIIAVGHTDSVGSDEYNQKLSVRRSEAVKAYLVSKGIEKNRVYTEGKGEKQPIADNKTAEGRAKNRRVEIEVVGTRSNK